MSGIIRSFPWFSAISAVCLLCAAFGFLGSPVVTAYHKGPLVQPTRRLMEIGAGLAPFAALYAAWLANRRGEGTVGDRRGCLLLSAGACGLVLIGAGIALVGFIRGTG